MNDTYITTGQYLSPASFWVPQYLEASAWADHAPFAFWLIEHHRPRTLVELGTHGGYSYFAFCQAVKAFSLSTRCYAIDTWKGDEHTGFYGEDFYQRVESHNETHYAAFSRLVRTTFDEALKHFNDGSIDLLHIDGRHFYDDVKHDFETWQPKLSNQALVLFHDINVRERDFGVSRLWENLKETYPNFEFLHGHGLGILGFGKELPETISKFLDAGSNATTGAAIRHTYAQLGATLKAKLASIETNAELADRESEILHQSSKITMLEESIKTQEEHVYALNAELKSLREDMSDHRAHKEELKIEAERQKNELKVDIKELETSFEEKVAEVERLEAQILVHQQFTYRLKNSTAWRITNPIRQIASVFHNLLSFHNLLLRLSPLKRQRLRHFPSKLYRMIPLPIESKRAARNLIFRLGGPLFKNWSKYQNWEIAWRRKKRIDAGRSGAFWWKARPIKEVARPLDVDYSMAVPGGFADAAYTNPHLAVICHIFYEDLTDEFQKYLQNIPFPFDVFISTDTQAKKSTIENYFEGWERGTVEIKVTPNRGRDIAPKLIAFRDVYDRYDYALHLHSKLSEHASVLEYWRGFLLENLLGSPSIVRTIFSTFARAEDIGIIASQHFEPARRFINWGGNYKYANSLAKRMGFELQEDAGLDFPSGSMFWARTAALKSFLDLGLSFDDFAPEHGQIDGTMAHAIERMYYFSCEQAGYRWIKVSRPTIFETTPAIVNVNTTDELDQFIEKYTLSLTSGDFPAPRTAPLPPVGTSRGLISCLQDSSLGYNLRVDTSLNISIGIVTYNNTESQISRITDSARRSLERGGFQSEGRIFFLENGKSSSVLETKNPLIKTVSTKGNIGFGAGHNKLMKEAFARGAEMYVAANPDGAFHPDSILALAQMMEANKGRALIEAIQFPMEHPKEYNKVNFRTDWASGACIVISRKLYKELGGFDETFFMYCEDVDLSWRARAKHFPIFTCPRALFLHSVSNRPHNPETEKMILSSGVLLARKWDNPHFERRLEKKLATLGFKSPNTLPEIVPESWRTIPDFNHNFTFSRARW